MNQKKLKPGLVACYNILPGNREGLFRFRRFINLSLTYLLRHLLTAEGPTRGSEAGKVATGLTKIIAAYK